MPQYNTKLTLEFDSTYFASDTFESGEIFSIKSIKENEFLGQNKATSGTSYFKDNSYFVERLFDSTSTANDWLQFVQSTITEHSELGIILKASNIENI